MVDLEAVERTSSVRSVSYTHLARELLLLFGAGRLDDARGVGGVAARHGRCFEYGYLRAALRCDDGSREPCSACAYDEDIGLMIPGTRIGGRRAFARRTAGKAERRQTCCRDAGTCEKVPSCYVCLHDSLQIESTCSHDSGAMGRTIGSSTVSGIT